MNKIKKFEMLEKKQIKKASFLLSNAYLNIRQKSLNIKFLLANFS
jgi:hypothetical protein